MGVRLFVLCKKIHRLLVLVVAVLIVVMAGTGILMKYALFASKYFGFFDSGMIRYVHNNLSVYFAAVLGLMALTGLYIYLFTLKPRG